MKVRLDSDISETISKLNYCKENMDLALDIVNQVKAKIEDGSWTGESKEATASLIDLCIQFHTEINQYVEENYNVMKDLEENADYFMKNSTHAKEWR